MRNLRFYYSATIAEFTIAMAMMVCEPKSQDNT